MDSAIDKERVKGRKVMLGVTGGIAAYKACELARGLIKEGVEVDTVLTTNATRFISPLSFSSLTGRPALTEMFDETGALPNYRHLDLAREAELAVVAPTTANFLGKLANGVADDLLSTTMLAVKCPVLICPAMNARMWTNPVVERNVRELKGFGYHFIDPVEGELACGETGAGRLAPVPSIVLRALELLSQSQDLEGFNVLVTAGATREALDPVRFISNPATGKMGFALAEAARLRGAKVALISGPTSLVPPTGVRFHRVTTAVEMLEIVERSYGDCHIFISAAAVSDFTPVKVSRDKIKKGEGGMQVEFKSNPDILHMLSERKGRRIHVGFALETRDLETNAEDKLREKNLDLIVANDPNIEGAGFAVDTNVVTMIDKSGTVERYPKLAKRTLAYLIIDRVVDIIQERIQQAKAPFKPHKLLEGAEGGDGE
ncbi:MAG: bifunctional phosphopantothenoylcysteine decarboxylase/phosphopantothenate--cysteine ligase CoaBC [Candidatus Coatesbacteria bacterium]|nr:bifunctional phosphopantothenoylcysteine decarboxylase/phosphopantothenate--cysteine ligase CoaBC [Candidatus Coatesbacteria bacterium]